MKLFSSLANFGRRLMYGAILAILTVATVTTQLAGCAELAPFVVPVVTCAQQNVPVADVKRAAADLWAHNWADLEALAAKDGWPTVACIIGDVVNANPQLKPASTEFRRLHAVEFRAAESAMRCSARPYQIALAPAGGAGPAGEGGAKLRAAHSASTSAPPTPGERLNGGGGR